MRQPPRSSSAQTSVSIPIPAPTGGWNTTHSLAAMSSTDAIFIDNFWPTLEDVKLRKGWAEFASIIPDLPFAEVPDPHNIRSLLSYSPSSGVAELFAADETGIFNITAGGSNLVADTPSTNGYWKSVNISTAGGKFLWCCNGVDKSRVYDGTNWTLLDGTSTPAITGVTSTDIINVTLFKTRLMFVIKNSLSFGFLPVNSIAGAISTFPLGAIFRRGGRLVTIDTWSIDGGNGIDDYCAFITSEGEIAIYQGTDPGVAANWALVGVYFVGKPLSDSCTVKVGGDVILLTVQGVYPLSKALGFANSKEDAALSYKIQQVFHSYAIKGEDLFGWQVIFFPASTMVLINVPFKVDTASNFIYSYQFVMNTTNNSWARFTNMPAEAWCVHDNRLFFARHDKVFEAWTGALDGNNPVIGKVKQAFTTLGTKRQNKHVKMIKPIMRSSSAVQLSLGFDVDFKTDVSLQSQATFSLTSSEWDTALFDQAVWSGSLIDADWRTVSNIPGMWFSLNLKVESRTSDVAWLATQYLVQQGGIL